MQWEDGLNSALPEWRQILGDNADKWTSHRKRFLKNIAAEDFRSGKGFPRRLLKEKQRSRQEIEEICEQESPGLLGKIVLQSVRTLIRPRVDAAVKIQSAVRGRSVRRMSLAERVLHGVKDTCLTAIGMQPTRTPTTIYLENVADPTRNGAWFTPASGWPERVPGVPKWKPPASLVPTRQERRCLYDATRPLGELRIEILEAEHLPKLDPLSANDTCAPRPPPRLCNDPSVRIRYP